MSAEPVFTPIYLGIGNPLLDITVPSTPEYLAKFKLTSGSAIIADDSHIPIYADCVSNPEVRYSAGGASMNTARAVQWMLKDKPDSTAFIGCTGMDPTSETLIKAVKGAGVHPLLMRTDKAEAGKCAVLVTDSERTLVTHLGAAELYSKKDHMDVSQEVQHAMDSAKVIYSEGFFTTVSSEALIALGEKAAKDGKTFMFNISAQFLVNFFWDKMMSIIRYVDFIFCNETEAQTVAQKLGWPVDDLKDIAKRMANLEKVNTKKPRTVVITHGSEETVVCSQDGEAKTFAPIKCPKEKIADTNGCGDSFVGGFISQYLQDAPIETCVAAGHYCAWKCLQEAGCTYVGEPEFKP